MSIDLARRLVNTLPSGKYGLFNPWKDLCPDGWSPVVGRAQNFVLDLVSQVPELCHPCPEGLSFTKRTWTVVGCQRTPLGEFRDVLKNDQSRMDRLGPSDDDPGQTTNFLLDRLPPFRPGEVRAIMNNKAIRNVTLVFFNA